MQIHNRVKNYLRNRKAMAELHALDDKALADIGVSRSHIAAAVKNGR